MTSLIVELSPSYRESIAEEFTRLVSDPSYPCLGARSALRRSGCRVSVLGPMNDPETTATLARELADFAREQSESGDFRAYVALFAEPAHDSEDAFEHALWSQLSALSAIDPSDAWAEGVSADVDDPHFAFSFDDTAYFVIGLHPASSRLARRLPWPALVFNPHAQFERLRAEQRFDGLRHAIRTREIALQGSINPNLADRGERSEAAQYSGRATDTAWRCPFHKDGQ